MSAAFAGGSRARPDADTAAGMPIPSGCSNEPRGAAHAAAADATDDALRETQRRRHREKITRYRHKKKATIGAMKLQEQVLCAQLTSMLELHMAHSQSYQPLQLSPQRRQRGERDENATDALQAQRRAWGARSPTAMDNFVRVLTEKKKLQREQSVLRKQVDTFHAFHDAVHQTIHDELIEHKDGRSLRHARGTRGSKDDGSDGQQLDSADGCWVTFAAHEAPFHYVPYTPQECYASVTQTMRQVFDFQKQALGGAQVDNLHMIKLFDWTATLQLEWDDALQMTMIRYQFTKTFRNPARALEQVVDAEWAILHDPKLYQQIHCVPVCSHVLQRVGDDISVVLLNAPDPEQTLKFRSISIFSRNAYETPLGKKGYLVTMAKQRRRDLKSQLTSAGERVVYTSGGFLHTIFTSHVSQDDGAQYIEVEYGGCVPVLSEAQGRFLMADLGSACIRLESMLFPFRVLRSDTEGG
ncbi:hypothetical protein FI667_g8000, partial [Globisporangium splendens]